MIEPNLKNKVVLITGANNPYGIGAGIARAFAQQEAKIFLHYFCSSYQPKSELANNNTPGFDFYSRQNTKNADEVKQSIEKMGGSVSAWEGNLADPATIPALYEQVEACFGPVEVLVNNAAASIGDTFIPANENLPNKLVELWTNRPQTISSQSIDHHFAVNTRATALMMAEFARRHIEREASWGRIINISTDGAYVFPSEASYGASKLALEGYSRSAAVELGQFGITVNIISPGPIQTGWITPALAEQLIPGTPLGRLGKPKDIADVAVFLASEQARWLTGQTLHVGGGHFM